VVIGDPAAGEGPPAKARTRSRLFTVRLWREPSAGGTEWRGTVRDVVSGAFRGFRDWPGLTAFLAARLDEASPEEETK
jgi:hypothetical protein